MHKNLGGCAASLSVLPPSSLLLFLLPLFRHLLPDTTKESAGVLKLLSMSGRNRADRQTTFSDFWAERLLLQGEGSFSDNHIIHLFTIRLTGHSLLKIFVGSLLALLSQSCLSMLFLFVSHIILPCLLYTSPSPRD